MKDIICITSIPLWLLVIWNVCFPEQTAMYESGVKDTHREAFEMGLMTKEITAEDKVVYRWIETHKLGYEPGSEPN